MALANASSARFAAESALRDVADALPGVERQLRDAGRPATLGTVATSTVSLSRREHELDDVGGRVRGMLKGLRAQAQADGAARAKYLEDVVARLL